MRFILGHLVLVKVRDQLQSVLEAVYELVDRFLLILRSGDQVELGAPEDVQSLIDPVIDRGDGDTRIAIQDRPDLGLAFQGTTSCLGLSLVSGMVMGDV